MRFDRRKFLKLSTAAAAGTMLNPGPGQAKAAPPGPDSLGCLVDTTLCVGCRQCEAACNQRNQLPQPPVPFEETAVLENERRMDETTYTVVNKYYPRNLGTLTWRQRPTFVKFQCMHCNDPSCVSACIVGALTKDASGAVVYDAAKCIGCRYCMVACPFQVPAYEYDKALTPQVRKCTMCFDQVKEGGLPACAQICPREAITFGKRADLLRLARWRIKNHPGRYQDHIYGETEVGGTAWIYLASEPFTDIGFPKLAAKAPPRLTESIQHAVTGYLALPLSLFAVLGGVMWFTGFMKRNGDKPEGADQVKEGAE
ncbi:4Fe-4S ferredoxin [Desulfocarbo indianensis]|nr:4Fe-4S ferredoxin [Desulfocarbo indianensis]